MSDLLFDELEAKLNAIKEVKPISNDGKNIFHPFLSLFQGFLTTIEKKFDDFKNEMLEANQRKNEHITRLETEVQSQKKIIVKLENELDSQNQYERSDALILSGAAVPDFRADEDCGAIVKKLLKDHLDEEISSSDINAMHRLGPKNRAQATSGKRNIIVKFCRRDLRRKIIMASKRQTSPTLYCNESLTPTRMTIYNALRKMKKDHPTIVKGCTTIEGKIYAFTPPAATSPRDRRHYISCMGDLREFCCNYVKLPLENFLNNFTA